MPDCMIEELSASELGAGRQMTKAATANRSRGIQCRPSLSNPSGRGWPNHDNFKGVAPSAEIRPLGVYERMRMAEVL